MYKEENMQKRTILIMVMMALLLWQTPVMAGEVDILVEKLVEKGVLSKQDANVILRETKVEAEKERSETIAATKEALMTGKDAPYMLASALPNWIKNTAVKGDFRLRYESTERDRSTERDSKTDRHRGRYRFRIGFDTKINDKVNVIYGLASGGSDPRSTNQSFTDSFETPDLRLDYAYASYAPFDWMKLMAGQMKNPLWRPGGSYLWDGDIRPQGIAAQMNHKFGGVEVFMTSGFFVLDELSKDSNDPTMWAFQPGYKVSLGKSVYFKNALTIYEFSNVEGAQFENSAGTNSVDIADDLTEDYDAYVVSGELGCKTGISFMPYAAAYGEYINNITTSDSDSGHGIGIKFGHEKVKKGLWKAGLSYHRLERDAWLDVLPDSDTYGGSTNVKAIIAKLTYGLMDNVSIGGCYIASEPISGSDNEEDLFQLDLVFKF
jgi:hypothetical protein